MTETADSRPLNCNCGWWTEYNNDGEWGGYVRYPNPTCPSLPHPERFLTPRQRPDKVAPMTTDEYRTRKVYLTTPDVYESDLRQIVQAMDALDEALQNCGEDLYFHKAEVVLWSRNDYPVGTLQLDDDQWVFTPHNESDVEANVDVV